MLGARKLVWLYVTFHHLEASWLRLSVRVQYSHNSASVAVKVPIESKKLGNSIEDSSVALTLEDAKTFNGLTTEERLSSNVYEFLSFKLIKCTLDAIPGRAIIISNAGEPKGSAKMFMPLEFELERYNINENHIIQVTAKSMAEQYISTNSLNCVHDGDFFVPSKETVNFDFSNGHSLFPDWAFELITKAHDKLTNSLPHPVHCATVSAFNFPVFKFSDNSGHEVFTLSARQYFVTDGHGLCYLAIYRNNAANWVIGSMLSTSYGLHFRKLPEKGMYALGFTPPNKISILITNIYKLV
ncbi:hypothetical protein ABG067_004866 [Albugo candida]